MSSTTFTSGTVIASTWLNDVNNAVYNGSFPTQVSSAGISYAPSGTGAVTTTVQAKLQQTVSVKDFGAVGDGTTDDAAAINAAITSLQPGGGIVFFPRAIYAIGSPIVMKPFTKLVGVVGGETAASHSSWVQALPTFSGDSMVSQTGSAVNGELTLELSNMAFEGGNYVKNGVAWTLVHGGNIEKVTVRNVRQYGFKITNPGGGVISSNLTMTDCYVRMPNDQYFIDNATYPVYASYYLEGFYHQLTRCVSDGGQSGVSIGGGAYSGDNLIQNCHFEGYLLYGAKIADSNGYNQILGSTFPGIYSTTQSAVSVQIGVFITGTGQSNIIQGNVIQNIAGGTNVSVSLGIDIDTTTNNNIISDNVIQAFTTGMALQSSFNTCSNNSVQSTLTAYSIPTGANNTINGGFVTFSQASGYAVANNSGNETNRVTNLVTSNASLNLQNTILDNQPPCFSAYQSTYQTIPNVTPTKVLFQTSSFDTSGAYNTSTSVFTAPVSGYYQIDSAVQLASVASAFTLTIFVQSAAHKQGSYEAATAANVSSVVYLQAGWTCYISAVITGPINTVANAVSTWFNGFLIRRS